MQSIHGCDLEKSVVVIDGSRGGARRVGVIIIILVRVSNFMSHCWWKRLKRKQCRISGQVTLMICQVMEGGEEVGQDEKNSEANLSLGET